MKKIVPDTLIILIAIFLLSYTYGFKIILSGVFIIIILISVLIGTGYIADKYSKWRDTLED